MSIIISARCTDTEGPARGTLEPLAQAQSSVTGIQGLLTAFDLKTFESLFDPAPTYVLASHTARSEFDWESEPKLRAIPTRHLILGFGDMTVEKFKTLMSDFEITHRDASVRWADLGCTTTESLSKVKEYLTHEIAEKCARGGALKLEKRGSTMESASEMAIHFVVDVKRSGGADSVWHYLGLEAGAQSDPEKKICELWEAYHKANSSQPKMNQPGKTGWAPSCCQMLSQGGISKISIHCTLYFGTPMPIHRNLWELYQQRGARSEGGGRGGESGECGSPVSDAEISPSAESWQTASSSISAAKGPACQEGTPVCCRMRAHTHALMTCIQTYVCRCVTH